MIRIKKLSTYAPFAAIGIITLSYLAAQQWLFPADEETPSPPIALPEEKTAAPPANVQAPVQETNATDTWPLYHGSYDLRGTSSAVLPEKPMRVWQYLGEGAIRQPPVGDARGVYVATRTGSVVGLDFSGNVRWTKQVMRRNPADGAEMPERFEAPVACIRSTVLIGSTAGIVYALDSETGAERWKYDVGGEVLGTVTAYEPANEADPVRLFVIERAEGALHCIDFETGSRVWRTDPINRTDGSAVVGNDMVVFGSCEAAIHVYSIYDGRLMRSVALCGDCQVAAGIALVGDEVFSGCRSGHFYRVNARVGSVVWQNEDSEKDIFSTPTLCSGVVVFGSEDGTVYALDPETGKQKWQFKTDGNPLSPVSAGDKIAVSVNGTLHFLSAKTGESIWSYEVSDAITSPSLINGMVIVGGEDGSVTAFGSSPPEQGAS
ncbi:MAG: PQQ-binding-like beta-propeller repeat protein [Candidatus Hydrogenedentes bacterium]|nr:PQQ-binding-like beta-propeller repeat protein [Candidatus Hydrogenedentota bacterium]